LGRAEFTWMPPRTRKIGVRAHKKQARKFKGSYELSMSPGDDGEFSGPNRKGKVRGRGGELSLRNE